MSTLAGTGSLLRLALRRDRVRIPAWALGITLFVVVTASSFDQLYKTAAARAQFAASIAGNGTFKALYGPLHSATTGGFTSWRAGGSAVLLAGLMSLLLVVRHTRADEEAGRSELVGAAAVGRFAPIAAALLAATVANLLAALLIAVGLMGLGLEAGGSLALGLATAGGGLVFGALAAVVAQVASTARAASGGTGMLLGLAFVVRMVGDSGSGTLSWVSPIGWAQQIRAFGGDRWWALALPMAAMIALVPITFALVSRRDHGQGLLASRPGPATAPAALGSSLGLAWRLQRGAMLGWGAAFVLLGVVTGSIAKDIGNVFGDNPELTDVLRRLGGNSGLVDAYMAATLGLLALVAAAYMIQAVLRIRAEETSLRAEPVLATGVSRWRWAGAHLACALLGVAVILVAGGIGMGLGHGLRIGDLGGQVPKLIEASLLQVPAAWVLGGLAFALAGLLPRLVAISWVVFGVYFVMVELGESLKLPDWVLDLSPFRHAPQFPASDPRALPLLAMVAATLLLVLAGRIGLRRRDML
jgi:polyether ionophore transport system permease protein